MMRASSHLHGVIYQSQSDVKVTVSKLIDTGALTSLIVGVIRLEILLQLSNDNSHL